MGGSDGLTERDAVRLLARLLVSSPSEGAALLAPLSPSAVSTIVSVARVHGVEAWLAKCAPSATGAWRPLAEQRLGFLAARTRDIAALRDLDQLLTALECPWVVLKGRAVAEDLYPRPDMRHSVDIDLLVPPARFATVLATLESNGWQLLDRNWPLIAEVVPGELRLRSTRGDLLDLHWHVILMPEVRARLNLPTAHLLARRRILASGLPALHPADQLVHLGVHAASSGANRLMWLLDAGLAARRVTDWSEVELASRAARAGHQLALVLSRASRALGTPAPRSALANMGAGPVWRALCQLVDWRSPPPLRPDDPALARSMARSVRDTTAASLVEFARHGTAWFRAGGVRARDWASLLDPRNAGSLLHVSDDETARQHYLRIVAASG